MKKEKYERIVAFSDNCYGQNKNQASMAMFNYICSDYEGVTIKHYLVEKGHSEMECDSIHSTVEGNSNHIKVHVPIEWEIVVALARKKSETSYSDPCGESKHSGFCKGGCSI